MYFIKTTSINLPEGVVLKKEAKEIFELFRCHAFIAEHTVGGDHTQCLCLIPHNGNDSLEDILDEGMYDYYSTNPYAKEMIEILEELTAMARPILFDESDIFAMT